MGIFCAWLRFTALAVRRVMVTKIRLSDNIILFIATPKMARRPESFDALEETWRKRVESAREGYLAAVSQTEREAERERELPAGDRVHSRAQATLAQREALSQSPFGFSSIS